MQLHLPHITLSHPFKSAQVSPRTPDHIPTTEELACLFSLAQRDLQVLEAMHALKVQRFNQERAGIIGRMADLIGANERYYGTDLRMFID